MQSFFIGVGAVIAGALPWVMTNWLGLSNTAPPGEIPQTVHWAFYIGGAALLAAVCWTVFKTREYSPEELAAFEASRRAELGLSDTEDATVKRSAGQFRSGGLIWLAIGFAMALFVWFARQDPRPASLAFLGSVEIAKELYVLAGLIAAFGVIQLLASAFRQGGRDDNGFMEVVNDLFAMPKTMQQLAVVQFFSWFAMFSMWIYGTPAVAEYHFLSPDPATSGYQDAADWWSLLGAVRNGVAAAAALGIIWVAARVNRRNLHSVNLIIGAVGFVSILAIRDPALLWLPFVFVGIAWASIVSLPYAILSGAVPPRKMGIYMGIFNIFIVVPQLVAATVLGFLLKTFFGGEPIYALLISGVSLAIAGAATLFVTDSLETKTHG